MRNLISKIAEELKFKYLEIESLDNLDLQFFYFEGKQDYYLFAYTSIEQIIKNSEDEEEIEYFLNSSVINIKEKISSNFNDKSLDRNLSLIVIIEDPKKIESSLKLHKIEENYFIAKKYILTYTKSDYEELNTKFNNDNLIIQQLNQVLIENNNLLESISEDTWYNLLVKLFIKIPFLNYSSSKQEEINDLNKIIINSLSDIEKTLFHKLLIFDDNDINIEEFISKNNLLNIDNE